MRRQILIKSVQRFVPDARPDDVVYMWKRHPWMFGYSMLAGVAMLILVTVLGFEAWTSRLGIAGCAAVVAGVAATEYRILVATPSRRVLLQASRIRQVATGFVCDVPASTPIEPVGSNLVLTDWKVGDERYTVPKRSEASMTRISGGD